MIKTDETKIIAEQLYGRSFLALDECSVRIYNLRKELARQIWAARKSEINLAEANEYSRDLVAVCPDNIIEAANNLHHKIMGQIHLFLGKKYLVHHNIKLKKTKVSAVKTRDYLGTVRLPKNIVG